MIGILTLCWLYYFRTYVLNKSRSRINILTAKDGETKLGEPIIGLGMSQPTTNSTSSNNNNSVPWMEFLNKPSFWSLIIAVLLEMSAGELDNSYEASC